MNDEECVKSKEKTRMDRFLDDVQDRIFNLDELCNKITYMNNRFENLPNDGAMDGEKSSKPHDYSTRMIFIKDTFNNVIKNLEEEISKLETIV